MCGIIASIPGNLSIVENGIGHLKDRGPDSSSVENYGFVSIGVTRLAITDLQKGHQPLLSNSGKIAVIFNGAIYNSEELQEQQSFTTNTMNDGEIIHELYRDKGLVFADYLEGMFAIIMVNLDNKEIIVSRDRLGIKPLFWASDGNKMVFSSSITSFPKELFPHIKSFPPGVTWSSKKDVRAIHPVFNPTTTDLLSLLRLEVRSHIPKEVPWGCLLSGGVDSSLIAALSSEISATQLDVYTVGTKDSEDLIAARRLATFFDWNHHTKTLNKGDVENSIDIVVKSMASYDPISVMSGIGTYQASLLALDHGKKVLLSGEGADELFAGYKDYQKVKYLNQVIMTSQNDLQKTECLRLDKCAMAASIEARVPFLSNSVIQYSNSLPENHKILKSKNTKISKVALRNAASKVLPAWIAGREKVPFFSGAGISNLSEQIAEERISDTEFNDFCGKNRAFRISTKLGMLFFQYWKEHYADLAESYQELVEKNLIRTLKFGRNGF